MVRGPLVLLAGLLFVACQCGNSGGGDGGCNIGGFGGGGGSTSGCGTGFGVDGGGYGGYGASNNQAGAGGCRFGFDTCGQDATCASNLREDPNCGECGHACGSAPCNRGACGADTLLDAGSGRDVTALLAAHNRLYYAESSDLSRIAFLDQSGTTDLALLSGPLDVSELARGGGRLFALEPDHNDVLAMDDAPGAQLAPLVKLDGDAEALVADDSYAYVASTRSYSSDAGLDASFTEAGVLEAGVDGSMDASFDAQSDATAASDASFDAQSDATAASDATVADANDAALESSLPGADASLDADASSSLDAASDADASHDGAPVTDAADAQAAAYSIGRVQRVPIGGGATEAVIAEPGRARSLALASGTLFVGYSNPGRLYAIDTTTLGATLIAEGSFDPARLAVGGTTAYATDEAGKRVLSIELSSGVVQVVTQTPSAPYDVRTDGGKLWFTTADPGQLYAWQPPNELFVAGLLRPRTPIALDPQYLYWSSPGTGILRVAR